MTGSGVDARSSSLLSGSSTTASSETVASWRHLSTMSSVWANHFLKRPSSFFSTSFFVMSNRHLGRFGHDNRSDGEAKGCVESRSEGKSEASSGKGRGKGVSDAILFVSSRKSAPTFTNAD
jgi:hypothetical protein